MNLANKANAIESGTSTSPWPDHQEYHRARERALDGSNERAVAGVGEVP